PSTAALTSARTTRSSLFTYTTLFRSAVVEHVLGAGIADDDVLGLTGQIGARGPGQLVGAGTARGFRPDPFRVTGEALVQPDVAPALQREAVAEPLVGQFVGDQALRTAPAVTVAGGEDGDAPRLDRDVAL